VQASKSVEVNMVVEMPHSFQVSPLNHGLDGHIYTDIPTLYMLIYRPGAYLKFYHIINHRQIYIFISHAYQYFQEA
jgi:hypothetical protein